jgi:hypothetical protein
MLPGIATDVPVRFAACIKIQWNQGFEMRKGLCILIESEQTRNEDDEDAGIESRGDMREGRGTKL